MDHRVIVRNVAAGAFIASFTWAGAIAPARYGGVTSVYLSEVQLMGLLLLAMAILTWLFLGYVRVDALVFVTLALVLPFTTLFVYGGLQGVIELHPVTVVLAMIHTAGFLAGVALRRKSLTLVQRYPTILEPLARHKSRLLLATGILVAGLGAVQYVTAPTPTAVEAVPGHEGPESTFDVELISEPANYRVAVETPTGETFDEWIAAPEFRDEHGHVSVRIASPSAAPSAGTYRLAVENMFGKTVYETELTFDREPNVVVSDLSVEDDGAIVTVELENTGDLPAPLWDHELLIDRELHLILEDHPASFSVPPGETIEMRGEIGRVPITGGRVEPVTLEPGTYEIQFELRATNHELVVYTETIEIRGGGSE